MSSYASVSYTFFWLLNIALSLQPENISLEKVWEDISITEQYKFQSPQVTIHCACCSKQNQCGKSCTRNVQYSLEEICITRNVSALAQCKIEIRPASNNDYYTTYKLNHARQQVYFRISYPTGHGRQHIDIPRGIFRIKLPDNSILKLDTSAIKIDVLNAFTWFYGEKEGNNLRYEIEINELDQKSPSKLGWYRFNTETGKYDIDEEAVTNNLMTDDRGCPAAAVTWTFRGVHYYNQHGLLQSNLPGKTINEVSGGIVDDVKINPQQKTISVEYNKNSNFINFLPVYTSEAFNFSATLTLDKYHNKLIHVIIYEVKATIVNVEIGIPGSTRSMMSFYHEKPNQIHHYRISASINGWQWVCAYPADEIQRCTCVNADYHDNSVPKPRSNFNYTGYNFGYKSRKPLVLSNGTASAFSRASVGGGININVVYICVISSLVLFYYDNETTCLVQYSDVGQDTV